MKLTGPQVAQLNTILGKTVAYVVEHDKVYSEWMTITGLSITRDINGELSEATVRIHSVREMKDFGQQHLSEVLSISELRDLAKSVNTLAETMDGMIFTPEYTREILRQRIKISNLLDTYPGDYAGVRDA